MSGPSRRQNILSPVPSKKSTVHPPMLRICELGNVYDGQEGNHISWGVIDRPTPILRGGWGSLGNLYRCAIFENAHAKDLLEASGWLALVECPRLSRGTNELVYSLIERWWDLTHTFQLPGLEIGITPLDFTFLTGISIGMGITFLPFDLNRRENWQQVRSTYFRDLPVVPEEKSDPCSGKGMKVSILRAFIEAWPTLAEEERTEDGRVSIYNAFVLWTIGSVFFPNSKSNVLFGWFDLLDSEHSIQSYDWGTNILGRIYNCLDMCSRPSRIGSFNGMWMILECWFYMYFGVCEPLLRNPTEDPFPRALLWRAENLRGSKVYVKETGRMELETRQFGGVAWDVVRESRHATLGLLRQACSMSRYRVILWDTEGGKGLWYLGDRCCRQITGKIGIPADPIPSEHMLHGVAYNVYFQDNAQGWPHATTWFTHSDEDTYVSYWRRVSRGHIEPVYYRARGVDHIGGSAIPIPRDIMHEAPMQPASHEPVDFSSQGTVLPEAHDVWMAPIISGDLEHWETRPIPPLPQYPSHIQEAELQTRRPEEWKYMYVQSLRALHAAHVMYQRELRDGGRSRRSNTRGASSSSRGFAIDSQPTYNGGSQSSHGTQQPSHVHPAQASYGIPFDGPYPPMDPYMQTYTQMLPTDGLSGESSYPYIARAYYRWQSENRDQEPQQLNSPNNRNR